MRASFGHQRKKKKGAGVFYYLLLSKFDLTFTVIYYRINLYVECLKDFWNQHLDMPIINFWINFMFGL